MPKGLTAKSVPRTNAVRVMQIATGEAEETPAVSGRRRSGLAGAKARADRLDSETRSAIARKAAAKRWG